MPTVYRYKGYRFFFFVADQFEPPHIHVEKHTHAAKFWLTPLGLAYNKGFRAHELRELTRIIEREMQRFMTAWEETFGHLQ